MTTTGLCMTCGARVAYLGPATSHSCQRKGKAAPTKAPGRSHYNAKATVCERGHSHPSKVEARVCASVYAQFAEEIAEWGFRVYRNARLPLWNLPPTDAGIPHYCNVDFVVWEPASGIPAFPLGRFIAIIDAKSGKRSRDWERGRAAVEATYGVRIEERS